MSILLREPESKESMTEELFKARVIVFETDECLSSLLLQWTTKDIVLLLLPYYRLGMKWQYSKYITPGIVPVYVVQISSFAAIFSIFFTFTA